MFSQKRKSIKQPKLRKDSPEVIAAKEYLDKTHPTLIGRDSNISHLCGNYPFYYIENSQSGKYTRYHFCQGNDKRIIYIVLCDEEREKIIQLFAEKMKEKYPFYNHDFIYTDSLKGMFIGDNIRHRFFSSHTNMTAFMTDEGDIWLPIILRDEDMH